MQHAIFAEFYKPYRENRYLEDYPMRPSLPFTKSIADRFNSVFAALFCLLLLSPARGQDLQPKLAALEAYAEQALTEWEVPGFAMAVVYRDSLVFSKGFGTRTLGKNEPVDGNTIFAIASNSKAFTAACIGILVDEGRLDWDDRVIDYLPSFKLSDSYVTREMRIRDLMSHRSGLKTFGGDLLWYGSTYSTEEVLRRAAFLPLTSSFRSEYGYQNLMFTVAGAVVEAVTDSSWEDFVTARILEPLGMKRTLTSVSAFANTGNIATPHNLSPGKLGPVGYKNVDAVAAAAGLNSCVADLSRWMRLQLGRGAWRDIRIFSKRASWEMWTPHMPLPLSPAAVEMMPSRHFRATGLGWFLNDYQGRLVVSHGGALDGMLSQTVLVPEEELGVVCLTNGETALQVALTNKAVDLFLDAPETDWSKLFLSRGERGKQREAKRDSTLLANRAKKSKPSLDLDAYAGTYEDVFYGSATITRDGKNLHLQLGASPAFKARLSHWHYDTFLIEWDPGVYYDFPMGFVTFRLDSQGVVSGFDFDQPNNDFHFDEMNFRR
ncbi:MAG: serine hydrolase [Calditrichaeota bacterium]|nr:serine hydrolase [Calditrichota bacterium]